MTPLLEKRFLVIAGKGGVGRTTLSLVFGKLAALWGKKTLVCLCSAPPRYSEVLGGVFLSSEIVNISPGFDVVNLEPKASQEEYGLQVLRNRVLHRLVFGSRVVRAFLDAVPGLAEWAMLGKASYHALHVVDGSPEYDIVIFDSPATGHGLDILALPRAIAAAVPAGRMKDEALVRRELLEDPARCEVVPVTLPEEMPVSETIEFVEGLLKLGLHVERVIINRVDKDTQGVEIIERFLEQHPGESLSEWFFPSAVAVSRLSAQRENISRLRRILNARQLVIPMTKTANVDEASLHGLVEALAEQLSSE